MAEITFSPSSDVMVVLNALLDIFERRTSKNGTHPRVAGRSIKVNLTDISLPAYFSQFDPHARFIANEQFQTLERAGLVKLIWMPGESGHLQNGTCTNCFNVQPKPTNVPALKTCCWPINFVSARIGARERSATFSPISAPGNLSRPSA